MFETAPISIEVGDGDNKQTFEMAKDVLCFYSGYFKTSLNSSFAEAKSGVVKLKDEDPKIVDMFVNYMLTRCLLRIAISPEVLLSYETLVDLWIFADAHDIPTLQNETIDILVTKLMRSTDVQSDLLRLCKRANGKLLDRSRLRELLLTTLDPEYEVPRGNVGMAWDWIKATAEGSPACPKQLLQDFKDVAKDIRSRCEDWHTHGAGRNCTALP